MIDYRMLDSIDRWRTARAGQHLFVGLLMSLLLVVPGLLAQPLATLERGPLADFARFARSATRDPRGIESALIDALGMPSSVAPAPLMAEGAGLDVDDRYVVCAEPVSLAGGADGQPHIVRVDDLTETEAESLCATLDRHFSPDSMRFNPARPATWFAFCERPPPGTTFSPLSTLRGRPLAAELPRDEGGGTWRRWQSEIEMLLFEHPVNQVRAESGRAPVNAIWFWGGGMRSPTAALGITVYAASGREGDLARGLALVEGGAAEPLPGEFPVRNRRQQAIYVLDEVRDAGALARCTTRWLERARDELFQGRLGATSLIADGDGAAAVWRIDAPSAWERLIKRVQKRALALPGAAA
jgi:hypothetical protein